MPKREYSGLELTILGACLSALGIFAGLTVDSRIELAAARQRVDSNTDSVNFIRDLIMKGHLKLGDGIVADVAREATQEAVRDSAATQPTTTGPSVQVLVAPPIPYAWGMTPAGGGGANL